MTFRSESVRSVDIGVRFERLLVIGLIPDRKNPRALCRCDCGTIVSPQRGSLVNGRAKSCGCLRLEYFLASQKGRPKMSDDEARKKKAASSQMWHKKNLEKAREKTRKASRKHYALHKEKCKSYQHARRARMKGAKCGNYDIEIEKRLWVLQHGKCAICHVDLHHLGHHVDHIMPLSRGGFHENSNLQLLCPTCNLSKGAKHPIEFMQTKGFLL